MITWKVSVRPLWMKTKHHWEQQSRGSITMVELTHKFLGVSQERDVQMQQIWWRILKTMLVLLRWGLKLFFMLTDMVVQQAEKSLHE
jgi:hypothetical protein